MPTAATTAPANSTPWTPLISRPYSSPAIGESTVTVTRKAAGRSHPARAPAVAVHMTVDMRDMAAAFDVTTDEIHLAMHELIDAGFLARWEKVR